MGGFWELNGALEDSQLRTASQPQISNSAGFFYPGENRQVNVNPRQVFFCAVGGGPWQAATAGARSRLWKENPTLPSVSDAAAGNGRIDGLPRTHPSP